MKKWRFFNSTVKLLDNLEIIKLVLLHRYGVNLLTAPSKDCIPQTPLSDGVVSKITPFLFASDDFPSQPKLVVTYFFCLMTELILFNILLKYFIFN